MPITFQLKGEKEVKKQIEDHVRLERPLQTDRHRVPDWDKGRVGVHTKVTQLHFERTPGDFDARFKSSPDVELSIDYQKDQAQLGFYHHKGIRSIGLYESGSNTLITEVKFPNGSKAPVKFLLTDLAYWAGDVYYQGFYELWNPATEYAEDAGLDGAVMDLGGYTDPVTDIYDLNTTNTGPELTEFDLNT